MRSIRFKQIIVLILIFFFLFGDFFNLKKKLKDLFKYLNNSIFKNYKKKETWTHIFGFGNQSFTY